MIFLNRTTLALGISLSLWACGAQAQSSKPAVVLANGATVTAGPVSAPVSVLPAPNRKRVDVDARIKIESRSIGSDGVTRTSVYEETWMRRGQQVWTQRVLPKGMGEHKHSEGKTGHKHLNPFEGGRLIDWTEGKAQMTVVVAQDKVVVAIPSVEFGNLGFDGSWERAYYMVTEREMQAMPASGRKSEVPGTRWLERKGEVNESVLWDEALMLPRSIESSNRSGSQWRRITVTPNSALSEKAPWLATQGFEQKIYADYLD